MDEEYLKRLGLSIARGVPQMATGFVDLAALPFTMTGLLEPEEAVGSTAYLTSKGLLPPPQEGVIPETLEMVSGSMSPQGAATGGLLALGTMAGAKGTSKLPKFTKSVLETAYHGTSPEAAKAIEKSGFDLSKSADGTVWLTSNPEIGEVAATGKGGIVKRMIDQNNLKLGGWEETDKYSTDELIQMGYDGLKLVDDDEITYQIFFPEKLIKP